MTPTRPTRRAAVIAAVLAMALMVAGGQAVAHPDRSSEDDAAGIRALLMRQQAAWNRGDIDAFMDGYWRSDDLRFASGGSITSGWQPTLERYLARYDSRAKMGQLAFSDLDIQVLGPDAATVFGRWRLTRESDTPGGLFTLVLRRIDGAWRIVHDHTSSE